MVCTQGGVLVGCEIRRRWIEVVVYCVVMFCGAVRVVRTQPSHAPMLHI